MPQPMVSVKPKHPAWISRGAAATDTSPRRRMDPPGDIGWCQALLALHPEIRSQNRDAS